MALPLCEELLHFSDKPLAAVLDAEQGVDPDVKPDGLWVSVGPAWAEWCLSENFASEHLLVITRVELAVSANILRISDAAGLDAFTERYGVDDPYRSRGLPRTDRRYWDIAWRNVAAEYDGIIIAPYIWSRRLDLMWYYGWDVASGCIWNARAVASLESINLALVPTQGIAEPDPKGERHE